MYLAWSGICVSFCFVLFFVFFPVFFSKIILSKKKFFPVLGCCDYFLDLVHCHSKSPIKSAAIFIYIIYTTCSHGYIQKYMVICLKKEKAEAIRRTIAFKAQLYILSGTKGFCYLIGRIMKLRFWPENKTNTLQRLASLVDKAFVNGDKLKGRPARFFPRLANRTDLNILHSFT